MAQRDHGGIDVCEMMLSGQDVESRSDYVPWMENPCKLDCKSAPYASSWPLILILSVQVGPRHGSWHALDSTTATSSLACVNERSGGCRRVSCTPEMHRGRAGKPKAEPYDPDERTSLPVEGAAVLVPPACVSAKHRYCKISFIYWWNLYQLAIRGLFSPHIWLNIGNPENDLYSWTSFFLQVCCNKLITFLNTAWLQTSITVASFAETWNQSRKGSVWHRQAAVVPCHQLSIEYG